MRDYFLLSFVCFLLLNCIQLEAQTRHRVMPSKEKVIKSKLPAQELGDSVCFADSLDSLNINKNFLEVTSFEGVASWYSYRGGMFAASTKFKKGSVLRVINPVNKKSVTVVVNDYGPNKKKHPNRVLDLDKMAYKKIAPLGTGLVKIIILPLVIL